MLTTFFGEAMLSFWQRSLAYLFYLRRPVVGFVPVFLAFVVVLLVGGFCFQNLYVREPLTFPRALYITYALVFMEHLLPFPQHWLLQLFYVLLPPLGLVVILDGLVQFGLHLLRRDAGSRQWNRAMNKTLNEHVVLFGFGKAGLRIAQHLLQLGEQVCVLEKNPDCPNLAFAKRQGVPVLQGSGREAGILDDLNIQKAKSLILATDDDLANIELALDAKKAKPDLHIVLRVFDQELASKIRDSFGISMAFSTTALSAPLFATASCDRSIINAFAVGERIFVVAHVEIAKGSGLVGCRLKELVVEPVLYILSHRRGGSENFSPSSQLELAVGDVLTVQTEPQGLRQLHSKNQPVAGAEEEA